MFRSVHMFTSVFRCLQVFTGVYWCLQVCSDVYRCVQVFTGVFRWVHVYQETLSLITAGSTGVMCLPRSQYNSNISNMTGG